MVRKKTKSSKRLARHRKVRSKVKGVSARPRLSVYRSSKHIFLQLIDDDTGKTILGISDKAVLKSKKVAKIERAVEAGKLLAKKALEKGIKEAIFDRGGYKYHGRIKSAAEGAREGGLVF